MCVCMCVCVCVCHCDIGMVQGQTYFEVVKDGNTSRVLSCTTAWSMLASLGARGVNLGAMEENLAKSTLKGPVTSGGGATVGGALGGSAGVWGGVSNTSSDVFDPIACSLVCVCMCVRACVCACMRVCVY